MATRRVAGAVPFTRRDFLTALAAAPTTMLAARGAPAQPPPARARKPNIVLIVSDDQGYADVSCYDHPPEVSTPHTDRLAQEGARLTDGYAGAWVCAPTRAGLLTGRYQQRFGFYEAPDSRTGMPTSEITVADLLKEEGYATGVFGKWHLGLEPPYRPLQRGFDEFYGFLGHGGHDYFELGTTDEQTSIYRNDQMIADTGYLTDNLARESVSFVERHHEEPFFLYLPFSAVHWPLQAPEADIGRFNTGDQERDTYLAMLLRMDEAVGAVLDALERTGVDQDTLVFFFSDNGGARKNRADNGALRDCKHSPYEGGIRVPFLVRWPGMVPAGTVCEEPTICLDIMPTACAAAGIELPRDREYDGRNMLPALRGEAAEPLHEALFWKDDGGQWAVRAGDWKLLGNRLGEVELYNLDADLSETQNLLAQHPTVAESLRQQYDAWTEGLAPRIRRRRAKPPG